MAKTLKSVETKLNHWYDSWGAPASLGQYVARIGKALGVKWLVRTEEEGHGWSYDDSRHSFHDWKDAAVCVNSWAQQLLQPDTERIAA